jgi:hypothetical protein
MAILGFIVVVAGRAFSDATKMRVRSQNMIVSSEEAGRVMAFLKDDISQMGVKSKKISNNSTEEMQQYGKYDYDVVNEIYMNYNSNPKDLSSFDLKSNPNDNFDILTFRKAHYDNEGFCKAVLEVEWYVSEDGKLMRKCTPTHPGGCTNGTLLDDECPEELVMATNVSKFKFLPSKPDHDNALSPPDDEVKLATMVIDGSIADNPLKFTKNDNSSNPHVSKKILFSDGGTSCRSFNFKKGEEYAIEFTVPYEKGNDKDDSYCVSLDSDKRCAYWRNKMSMFQPGIDHLSVGLRSPDGNPITIPGGNKIPDFLFYPMQSEKDELKDGEGTKGGKIDKRYFKFSVPDNVPPACVGITAAFYSDAGNGSLTIRDMKVSRKTDNVYHFDNELGYNPVEPDEKASVKAFRIYLGIEKKKEKKEEEAVVAVPSNGTGDGS